MITGNVVATDVDDGASLTYSLTDPSPAGLTFNPNGSYSFDPTVAAYDHLAQGVTQDVVVHYKANDGIANSNLATLKITVTGTNDVPVIGGVATGAVTEDVAVVGRQPGDQRRADHRRRRPGPVQFRRRRPARRQQRLRHLHAGRRRQLDLHRRQQPDRDPAARRRPVDHRQLHRRLQRRHRQPARHRHHQRHQRRAGDRRRARPAR